MKTYAAMIVIVTMLFSGCFISADDDDDGVDARASCRVDCDDEVTTCRKACSGDACFVSCDTDHTSCVAGCD